MILTSPASWFGLVMAILGLPGTLDDIGEWRGWLRMFGDSDAVLWVVRGLGAMAWGGLLVWVMNDAWGWILPRHSRRRSAYLAKHIRKTIHILESEGKTNQRIQALKSMRRKLNRAGFAHPRIPLGSVDNAWHIWNRFLIHILPLTEVNDIDAKTGNSLLIWIELGEPKGNELDKTLWKHTIGKTSDSS